MLKSHLRITIRHLFRHCEHHYQCKCSINSDQTIKICFPIFHNLAFHYHCNTRKAKEFIRIHSVFVLLVKQKLHFSLSVSIALNNTSRFRFVSSLYVFGKLRCFPGRTAEHTMLYPSIHSFLALQNKVSHRSSLPIHSIIRGFHQ